jgi:tripartite-type tricarboxylate transporter receptor subunit TctC
VGGHTPIAFTALPPAAPQIKEGKLRALFVTSEKRVRSIPDVQKRLDDLGFEVVANTPAQFAERIQVELAKWSKVVRDAKIKVEGGK